MQDVFEYLDQAVATLSLIHNGGVGITCANCSKEFRKENNCLLYHTLEEIDQDKDVFYAPSLQITYSCCPISYLHNVIYDLWDNFQFIELMKPNMNMENTPAILYWFIKRYNYYDCKIKNYNIEQENKKTRRK